MDTLDLGRIPQRSLTKVRAVVKRSKVALSKSNIRDKTMIPSPSVDKILKYYIIKGDIRKLETSGGVFYEFAG